MHASPAAACHVRSRHVSLLHAPMMAVGGSGSCTNTATAWQARYSRSGPRCPPSAAGPAGSSTCSSSSAVCGSRLQTAASSCTAAPSSASAAAAWAAAALLGATAEAACCCTAARASADRRGQGRHRRSGAAAVAHAQGGAAATPAGPVPRRRHQTSNPASRSEHLHKCIPPTVETTKSLLWVSPDSRHSRIHCPTPSGSLMRQRTSCTWSTSCPAATVHRASVEEKPSGSGAGSPSAPWVGGVEEREGAGQEGGEEWEDPGRVWQSPQEPASCHPWGPVGGRRRQQAQPQTPDTDRLPSPPPPPPPPCPRHHRP